VGADLGEQANLLLVKVDVDENTALKAKFGITDEDEAPGKMLLAKKGAAAYETVTIEAGLYNLNSVITGSLKAPGFTAHKPADLKCAALALRRRRVMK
jgi:hypothetical protein